MKMSLRIKVAIGLGLLGIFTLIGAVDIQPTGWRDWLVVAGVFGKIGFLVYAAYFLVIADEEIEHLKVRNRAPSVSFNKSNSKRLLRNLHNDSPD